MIDNTLVQHLVNTQFPEWKDLSIQPIANSGWDNRTFHLGKEMLVRMPSAAEYATQVEKEHKWLPKLAQLLPLPIPEPLAMGEPTNDYPWKWSIYRFLDGETAASAHINDMTEFAASLAKFLIALQHIDAQDLPKPGPHNFYRGGMLTTYDTETRQAISILERKIDARSATDLWETALSTTWKHPPVPIHGDISAGNFLIQEGQLSAVIDFGMLAIGDPACDLAIAWTLFDPESRKVFREMLPLDKDTWERGRAWALWKSLIVAAGMTSTNSIEAKHVWESIDKVLVDHKEKS
ncbi:aminoglycoside phosphotransferase [Candidatus Aerophobetes bacterium]|uniref:Aminoglycoside phosphotransferase n=1 Tax=Aerophobetes bacterium TaxID=2030807 RepID=A0A2A4YDX3_UNCAE|nr:MAG: aminoglycoside phosphotransferase [Candidatus Aerophobetes bacterium]